MLSSRQEPQVLLLIFAGLKGQSIQAADLHGLWTVLHVSHLLRVLWACQKVLQLTNWAGSVIACFAVGAD